VVEVGASVGLLVDGLSVVGEMEGLSEGDREGDMLGWPVGSLVGARVGRRVESSEGEDVTGAKLNNNNGQHII
jgi:hypothetical protein